MHSPIHDLNLRKRVKLLTDPYPHPKFWVKLLDKIVLGAGVAGPVVTLPQIFKMMKEQSAAGVAIETWALFAFLDIPWIIYGYVHKEHPIMVSYTLWLIVNAAVVMTAMRYS